ncbi:MAG: ribosome maturation factor RimP [Oscillospiraceae bacterium]|nr:ribosome maturation factor RimP [Oscillospiraceae bacterium]MBR3083474.1 ribosome maturation factor RimP [Oscillospiraceae bacterium]
MNRIAERVRELALPVAAELGLELWDVEYLREAGQWYLRVYIDKLEGYVGIDDCERFSRALDPILDEADPIAESYTFEVSSAGAERELKRPGDFQRFLGSLVEVRLYQARDGQKSYVGTLSAYDNGAVTIETPALTRRFGASEVAQVRLRLA